MPTFTFQATSVGNILPLEAVPDEVRVQVEEVYEALRTAPIDGRMRATFDTEAEANEWSRQAASYCAQRPEGVLKYRRSPTRDLPKTVIDFRISADLPANGSKNGGKPSEGGKPNTK